MHNMPLRGWIPLLLAGLTISACSNDPNRPYPVRGVILFEDDQPAKELAGGLVTFALISESGGGSSVGAIGEDATFSLSFKREGDGAVAGRHRVTISMPEPEDGEDDKPKKRRRPLKAIIDPATANQEFNVEPTSNTITLKVKRAREK